MRKKSQLYHSEFDLILEYIVTNIHFFLGKYRRSILAFILSLLPSLYLFLCLPLSPPPFSIYIYIYKFIFCIFIWGQNYSILYFRYKFQTALKALGNSTFKIYKCGHQIIANRTNIADGIIN